MQGNIAADGTDQDEAARWHRKQDAEQRLSAAEEALARGAQVSLTSNFLGLNCDHTACDCFAASPLLLGSRLLGIM